MRAVISHSIRALEHLQCARFTGMLGRAGGNGLSCQLKPPDFFSLLLGTED